MTFRKEKNQKIQKQRRKTPDKMFAEEIRSCLEKAGIAGPELITPPDPKMGDFAFACFQAAKGSNPKEFAEKLKEKLILPSSVDKAVVMGPYLNFYLKHEAVAKKVIPYTRDPKKPKKKADKVMVEFSQANTHKAFHVGHIRGTSLGESLSRILKAAGYSVTKANYQGDTGAHVAKWLWCYKKYHYGEKLPKKDPERWIADIYVESVKRIEEDPDLQSEVDEINRQLEDRSDHGLVKLWEKTRQWSLDSLENIYHDLDVTFDEYFFEGQMEERAKEISQRLVKEGIAKINEGATIMDLEEDKLGIWVLLRKDGTTLYSAKDLALAEDKFNKYKITRSIYVVGAAQSLHFRQLFKTLEKMKFKNVDKCEHLAFAEVRFPHGKMSSRTGDNMLYSGLKKEMLDYARKEVRKRHDDWTDDEVEESAMNIAIGAMKFSMLSQDPNKNIIFDIDKVMDFEGETGPYIQYAHARVCSILRKYGGPVPGDYDPSLLTEEKQLFLQMMRLDETIEEVSRTLRVNTFANYTLKLAQMFNEYYHKNQVLVDDEKLRDARIVVIDGVRIVLEKCLNLLAITAPERM